MTSFPQTPVPQTPGGIAAQGWMEDIKRVITFDSVEEFWGCVGLLASISFCSVDGMFTRLYNNIVPPSQLPQKANYYLFKVGGFSWTSGSVYSIADLGVGGNYPRLGGRGQQKRWQMEHSASSG